MLTFKSKLILVSLVLVSHVASADVESLLSVRFGSHQGFDRMVCEFSGLSKYEVITSDSGGIELHLSNVTVGEKFFLPKLPSQIKLLTKVEAFRESDSSIVIEIRGVEALYAKTTELKGQSWRLAVDMSKLSEKPIEPPAIRLDTTSTAKPQPGTKSDHDEPAPYVPGDKPIETKFADEHTKPVQPAHTKHDSVHEPLQEALQNPESLLASDSLKALEVLAEFYDVMGDQEAARDYARLYLGKKDFGLTRSRYADQDNTMPGWLLAIIAFVAGIAGGILGNRLRMSTGKFSLPKLRFPFLKLLKRAKSSDEAEELNDDLASLDKAVASEKPKPVAKQPSKPVAVKAEVPQEVIESTEREVPEESNPTDEAAMKESLMDRRVKRVLELSAEKRSLAEIAKELDMGQDEVKLILDLHS